MDGFFEQVEKLRPVWLFPIGAGRVIVGFGESYRGE